MGRRRPDGTQPTAPRGLGGAAACFFSGHLCLQCNFRGSPESHLPAATLPACGLQRGQERGSQEQWGWSGSSSCLCVQAAGDLEQVLCKLLLSSGPLLLMTKIIVLAGAGKCSGSTGTLALAVPEYEAGRHHQAWVPKVDGAGPAVQTLAARRAGGQCGY